MPLPINTTDLVNQMRATLTQIDKQIETIRSDAYLGYRPIEAEPPADLVYRMKNRDGTYVLTDLLAAKAQCLAAIANLQAAQTKSR